MCTNRDPAACLFLPNCLFTYLTHSICRVPGKHTKVYVLELLFLHCESLGTQLTSLRSWLHICLILCYLLQVVQVKGTSKKIQPNHITPLLQFFALLTKSTGYRRHHKKLCTVFRDVILHSEAQAIQDNLCYSNYVPRNFLWEELRQSTANKALTKEGI